jgi:hypothetical protein
MTKENTNTKIDTEIWAKFLITLSAVIALIIYRNLTPALGWQEVALISLGILPWISSFIQSFKVGTEGIEAVFKEMKEIKEEVKEVKQSSEVNQSINTFGTGRVSEKINPKEDEADPQKGKWSGKSTDDLTHRKLTADIKEIPSNKYLRRVVFRVESTDPINFALKDTVVFHLHPTFNKPIVEVKPIDNVAEISLVSYGAFTVGAETDKGQTKLELDLAESSYKNDDPFFKR